jgi:WD40 repeat protein
MGKVILIVLVALSATFLPQSVLPQDNKKPRKPMIELVGHKKSIYSVAISPNNRFVVTGSFDKTARIWDANNGSFLYELEGHNGSISSVAISPNNRFVVTGSFNNTASDNTARIWDANNGSLLHELKGHKDGIYSVTISPNNRFVVTGSSDNTARIWDVEALLK